MSPAPVTFVDLSHTIEHGMTTYPGLPGPLICDFLSREASRDRYAPGVEFHIGKIEMVANTGTYLDAPFHRYAHGKDLSALPLSSLAGLEAILIRGPATGSVGREAFRGRLIRGKAVLVCTGWDAHWGTPAYLEGNPYLTADAAAYLADEGAALVGIDSLNIDDLKDLARPVHSTLLAAEIPIVEHLTGLEQVPPHGARFTAAPPRLAQLGTFPVRAFAVW
jgi:kynurenine formamidase